MRLDGHNLGVLPELMAEHAESADVGSDLADRLEGVWPQRADLVFVMEHRVGELATGRLDVKVAAEGLLTGGMDHGRAPNRMRFLVSKRSDRWGQARLRN
jgi:hypothetical protein